MKTNAQFTCGGLLWFLVSVTLVLNASPPIINYHSHNQTVILHQPVAIGVIVSGTAPLFYQWRKDAVPISHATNDQIVHAHAQFSDAGFYSAVVSNVEGSVTSAPVALTVNTPMAGDVDFSFGAEGSLNRYVRSVTVQPDGKVLIAGDFTAVNRASRGRIARLNTDGTTDLPFMDGLVGANGEVFATAVQTDGKVLIGGSFTTVNGVTCTNLARLNADGTLDSSFQSPLAVTNGTIRTMAVQGDGKVVVGGSVIARLNPDGAFDSGFQNQLSRFVASMAAQRDGKIVLGASSVRRLNLDGSADGSFLPTVDGYSVASVAVQEDGKLLIGGQFSAVNGVSSPNLARLNPDGTLDTNFLRGVSGPNSVVASVAVQADGKILIGGYFKTVNGVSRSRIARLNADGSLDTAFLNGLSGANAEVYSVAAQSDGKVLIGGFFRVVNDRGRDFVARLNIDGSLDNGFQNGVSGVGGYRAYSLAMQSDGKILIGGSFVHVNGVLTTNFARLNPDGTLDTGFLVGHSYSSDVYADDGYLVSAQSGGKVLVTGRRLGTYISDYMMRLNQDGSRDSGFSGGANPIYSMAGDGNVLIGGGFTKVYGYDRNRIARLNSDGSLDENFLNGLAGANASVNAVLLQSDGNIVIAGDFTTVNNVVRNRIARLRTNAALDSTFLNGASGANGSVKAAVLQPDGSVVIGGSFTIVNGVGRNRIARLRSDGTLDSGFLNDSLGADGAVILAAVQRDGKVLIAGDFRTVNGVTRRGLARLNSDGNLDMSFFDELSGGGFRNGLPGDGGIRALAVQDDGRVVIAGDFTTFNNAPAAHIVRLWGAPVVRPLIKTIDHDGGVVNLIWNAISNQTYRVQYKTNTSMNGWINLAGDVLATNDSARKTDTTLSNATQRYYQVLSIP